MTGPIMGFTPVLLTPVAAVVTGVGECVVAALAASHGGSMPTGFRYCPLLPTSLIPWDNCSCGGQFAQAIQQRYGSMSFPAPFTGNFAKCGPQLDVAPVLASYARCVTTMNAPGQPPPCSTALFEALQLESDRETIRRAINCCLQGFRNPARPGGPLIIDYSIGPTVTVGELSGCVALETPYSIAVASGCC